MTTKVTIRRSIAIRYAVTGQVTRYTVLCNNNLAKLYSCNRIVATSIELASSLSATIAEHFLALHINKM